MAEMLVQSENLVAIADKIRVLSGTSATMGLDAMATHIGEANTNVDTETDLIAQISSALEGKAGGGSSSGSGGGSVETVSYTYNNFPEPGTEIYYIDGTLTLQHEGVVEYATYNIAKGTIFVLTGSVGTPFGTYLCGNSICRAILADG